MFLHCKVTTKIITCKFFSNFFNKKNKNLFSPLFLTGGMTKKGGDPGGVASLCVWDWAGRLVKPELDCLSFGGYNDVDA